MAVADIDIDEYLKLIPAVKRSPGGAVWLSYDAEADTLYVNFKTITVHFSEEPMP